MDKSTVAQYDFDKCAGIIYKREKPENRWKDETDLIPKILAEKFLEEARNKTTYEEITN